MFTSLSPRDNFYHLDPDSFEESCKIIISLSIPEKKKKKESYRSFQERQEKLTLAKRFPDFRD